MARLARKLRKTVQTASEIRDYTRNLLKGNRTPGEIGPRQCERPPVVLAHGFLGTKGSMSSIAGRLRQDGRIVLSYPFGTFNLASLRATAEALNQNLRQVCERLHVPAVDVVGFSMGGLVSLHAIKFLQGHQYVRRLVLLGSPLSGSWLSVAGIAALGAVSPSVWQVLPGSSFLKELHAGTAPKHVSLCQIHAADDAFVRLPERMPQVNPSDYVVVPGGHTSLTVGDPAYQALRNFLAQPQRENELPGIYPNETSQPSIFTPIAV